VSIVTEQIALRVVLITVPHSKLSVQTSQSSGVTGNAGVAKIVLEYPTVTFTDYMSLLKVGDEWKIVNKVFYAEPKAKP